MTTTRSERLSLVMSGAALLIAVGTLGGPAMSAVSAVFDAQNADKVDGKHAVGAGASVSTRKGKLVATSATTGRLPNNIIAKAPDAGLLDGFDSTKFLNNSATDSHVNSGGDVLTISELGTWTTAATTTLTTDGASSSVLVLGHLQAQNGSGTDADVFAQVLVDGDIVSDAWGTMSAGGPVFPRTTLPVSTIVQLPAGLHTITLRTMYWKGGTDQNVLGYSRSISAVELG